MMVNVELGVSMGDDAALYLCVVLQHTIERLVAGALASGGKPELRTKYGGAGKIVQPGADVQPRHIQVRSTIHGYRLLCCVQSTKRHFSYRQHRGNAMCMST